MTDKDQVMYLKGRESVWMELWAESLSTINKWQAANRELQDKLKDQANNETLIDNQASRIRNMEDKLVLESARVFDAEQQTRKVQTRYDLLLEMCMNINNLSAEQRLGAIRREHKPEWEAYLEQKRKDHDED